MNFKRKTQKTKISGSEPRGFSLIESLIGTFLISVALLGLAQLLTFGILKNTQASRVANAVFLARQSVENIRNLRSEAIAAMADSIIDQSLDLNNDGTTDFRRVIKVQTETQDWSIRVLVFPGSQENVEASDLYASPQQYRLIADIGTRISR